MKGRCQSDAAEFGIIQLDGPFGSADRGVGKRNGAAVGQDRRGLPSGERAGEGEVLQRLDDVGRDLMNRLGGSFARGQEETSAANFHVQSGKSEESVGDLQMLDGPFAEP